MDCEKCGTTNLSPAKWCRACGHPVIGEIRENAATAATRRVTAAVEDRDFDALADTFADDYVEAIQDPGRSTMNRDHVLEGLRSLFGLANVSLAIEPLATLGESLQLHRTHISGVGGDAGSSTIDYISVIEVDSEGRLLRTEAFDVEQLDEAITRMYEHYDEA
jgi:hypothetical protein